MTKIEIAEWKKQKVICIQIPLNDRRNFVELIEKNTQKEIIIESDKGIIKFIKDDSVFVIDVTDITNIRINLPNTEIIDLITAIYEHIEEDCTIPLDHSFESLGAKIIPKEIEDVIIETID